MTPDQIDDWLGHHSEEAGTRIDRGLRELAALNAHRGTLGSGAYIKERLAMIATEIGALVTKSLNEAEAVERAGGDANHLYDGLSTMIVQLSLRAREAIKLDPPFYQPSARAAAREIAMADVVRLQAEIRHHRAGFGRTTPVGGVNSVVIRDSPGSSVQQSSPGAFQANTVEVAAVGAALSQVEKEVPWDDLPATAAEEVRADLETIKAQLRKPKPSVSIMREAGATARSILENVVAGAMTPSAIAATVSLWRFLGL